MKEETKRDADYYDQNLRMEWAKAPFATSVEINDHENTVEAAYDAGSIRKNVVFTRDYMPRLEHKEIYGPAATSAESPDTYELDVCYHY